MPQIKFEKIIKAERNRVFNIISNYEEFNKILPQYFPYIRIRSRRGNVAIVEERLCIAGKELVMMTKHTVIYPTVHNVSVIGGNAKGSNMMEQYDLVPNGTKLIFQADIKLKGMMRITGMFDKTKFLHDYIAMMDEFAQIAED